MLPERLKSSKRHQAEVLLAGLALWQIKRQYDRRMDRPEKPEAFPYPLSERVEEKTVFVWPTVDESGEPRAVSVGIVDEEEHIVGVQGIFEKSQRMISELTSEKNKTRLRAIKKSLAEAKAKIEERAANQRDTS